MKRNENIEEILRNSLPSASRQQAEAAAAKVFERLQSDSRGMPDPALVNFDPRRHTGWRWVPVMAAAAAVVVATIWTGIAWNNARRFAVAQTADGGLYRVASGAALRTGDRIKVGEAVRTNGGAGSVLKLADGSHIEMRPRSELSVERADDGMRIRLTNGGVIVNAAKQSPGRHLYVQTRDVNVAVVGTVFLVNAEEAGSRVAVLQGEVHVEQGSASKSLLPGQQISTNPLMDLHPIREQVAWSQNASVSLTLLQQSPRLKFEADVIRPLGPGAALPNLHCRGVDGILSAPEILSTDFIRNVTPDIPQGRCVGVAFLRQLISIAYDIRADRISGDEPAMLHLEAKAEDPSKATKEDLREMLQTLLSDRFKLRVHRETGEVQGYVLAVSRGGVRFKEGSGDEETPHARALGTLTPGVPGQTLPLLIKGRFGMRAFAQYLSGAPTQGRPVIDRTGLPGIYDISLTLNQVPGSGGVRGGPNTSSGDIYDPPLAQALDDQLGLRLESLGKVPVEYLVVDHVEKATDN
jgi:uncharacterized protein (TIGR03435 family)